LASAGISKLSDMGGPFRMAGWDSVGATVAENRRRHVALATMARNRRWPTGPMIRSNRWLEKIFSERIQGGGGTNQFPPCPRDVVRGGTTLL